ncbi:hypothetical protein SB748_17070 [Rhizobium sp. SIMBA_035]
MNGHSTADVWNVVQAENHPARDLATGKARGRTGAFKMIALVRRCCDRSLTSCLGKLSDDSDVVAAKPAS